jgi:hypothetical protein
MKNEKCLYEIKKRAEAASPGLWRFDPEGWRNRVRQNEVFYDSADGVHSVKVCEVLHTNDGPFIAHAREDIPWLLAQLEAAQKVVEATRNHAVHTACGGKSQDWCEMCKTLDEYDAAQRDDKRY